MTNFTIPPTISNVLSLSSQRPRLSSRLVIFLTDSRTMAEFTYQDIAEHNTKNDAFVVIHDKVYDVTKFIDEHP